MKNRAFFSLSFVVTFISVLGCRAGLLANDVYLVRFSAGGASTDNCFQDSWQDNTIFLNTATNAQTVTLLGISDGELPTGAQLQLVIPAGGVITLRDPGPSRNWQPAGVSFPGPAAWFVHLDVPDTILVSSRAELGRVNRFCGPPTPGDEKVFGTVALPAFRALIPAGQPQYHIGTDLGLEGAHVNAIVFNAGTNPATATVELHDGCGGALLDSRSVFVGPNSTTVVGGLSGGSTNLQLCTRYVVVTMDQPGLSVTSVVANNFAFESQLTSPICLP